MLSFYFIMYLHVSHYLCLKSIAYHKVQKTNTKLEIGKKEMRINKNNSCSINKNIDIKQFLKRLKKQTNVKTEDSHKFVTPEFVFVFSTLHIT